jgi:hypothetical protein
MGPRQNNVCSSIDMWATANTILARQSVTMHGYNAG